MPRKRYTLTEDELVAKAYEIVESRCRVNDGDKLQDPSVAGELFKLKLGGRPHETFAVAFLTTKHALIAFEELFHGTIDGSEVHPRVVVKRALDLNAAAIILGHNHPSGDPEPSAADRAVTARIKQACALVDIRVLDHFIVGSDAPVSMAAKGMV